MSWWGPRSSKVSPEPATRCLTVLVTRTWPGLGLAGDAGTDVYRDAAELVADRLAFAGVQSGAHLKP